MIEKFIGLGSTFSCLPILKIDDGIKRIRPLCIQIDRFSVLVAVFSLILGISLLKLRAIEMNYEFHLLIYLVVMMFSIVIHEIGHLIAGVAANYKFDDAGILLLGFLPIGAYVSYKDNKAASKKEQAKLAMAGVVGNVLMFGVCMIIATLCSPLSYTFVISAFGNLLVCVFNLFPSKDLDGERLLSSVFEVNSIYSLAIQVLSKKRLRQRLIRGGIRGKAIFCLLGFVRISNYLLWMGMVASIFLCNFIFLAITFTYMKCKYKGG